MSCLPLSQLTPRKVSVALLVRVSRLWKVIIPNGTGEHSVIAINCVLIDKQGTIIEGTIGRRDVDFFWDLLIETKTYNIKKYTLVPNKKKYRAIDHEFYLVLNRWVTLEPIDDDGTIPQHGFSFLDFESIPQRALNTDYLTDVVGKVTRMSPMCQTFLDGRECYKRILEIMDRSEKTITITLWDESGRSLDENAFVARSQTSVIIAIFSGMSVKLFQGKPYLSSSSATRVYIDLLSVNTVHDIHVLFADVTCPIELITTIPVTTIPPEEEMKLNRVMLAELLSADWNDGAAHETRFTCKATIKDIDSSHGWWYRACFYCNGSVTSVDDTFWCSKCPKNDQLPKPWYKLNAIVEDATREATFVLFGRTAQLLIGCNASYLTNEPHSDRYTLPPQLRNIITQEHIFQVSILHSSIQETTLAFTVIKVFCTQTASTSTRGHTPTKRKFGDVGSTNSPSSTTYYSSPLNTPHVSATPCTISRSSQEKKGKEICSPNVSTSHDTAGPDITPSSKHSLNSEFDDVSDA